LILLRPREFPTWDEYYAQNEVEAMPWFAKDLDADVSKVIESKNITSGKFLDLGTGPGTQAMQLTKMGFETVGSDVSQNAIRHAQKLYPDTTFVVDDILNSNFRDNEFDLILDRGVFHVFEK
jgi:ubiquinone/menaquinone biosynthesis C-methylase UbiE